MRHIGGGILVGGWVLGTSRDENLGLKEQMD